VVLLHGWPYDIHAYVDVSPLLAAQGYRVIVPYLRGYGTTRFLSAETFRNGDRSALAVDTIALMDALGIDDAIVAGFDWGARTADIVAALWPERCRALVSVSGHLIGSQRAGTVPLPPEAERECRVPTRASTGARSGTTETVRGCDLASRGPWL
jgi:pimeloyl-ACP methyl ester carboxylesterase